MLQPGRVKQNVLKVGASLDLEIRSSLKRGGMSHYVRSRAHVWSTKEVQRGPRLQYHKNPPAINIFDLPEFEIVCLLERMPG